MEWNEAYPSTVEPTFDEITAFIGGEAGEKWNALRAHIETTYKAKPKLTYSVCSGKPGWNLKYAKSGQAFGTLYPEQGAFSVFLVVAYKLDDAMRRALPDMSAGMQEMYANAPDFMKAGRWMMFGLDGDLIEDYKKIIAVKMENRK